jgi:hypothetical protein
MTNARMIAGRQERRGTALLLKTSTACCLALLVSGCASTRSEAPPEVATQPPNTPASETLDIEVTSRHARIPQRNAPTDRTIEEIRAQYKESPMPLDFGERLDHAHDKTYVWAQDLIEATDHRFADKGAELKPVPAAPFRLGLTLESLDRSDGFELNLDADLNIALGLPNIETRLRFFVTSTELDEGPRDARSESALRAGLRVPFLDHFDFDVGVKLDIPPVAFTSVRWSRQYELGRWDFFPLAKLFADSEQGVGYVGAATFDRWSGRSLVRSSSFAKWRSDRDRIEWTQTLVYARVNQLIVPDRYGSYLRARDIGSGWGVRLLASAGETTKHIDYYEAGVFFRRPASNRWLYWHVEPLVRWDKEYNWTADAGLRIGIDALFWDLARPARR